MTPHFLKALSKMTLNGFSPISRKQKILDPIFINKSNINLSIPLCLSLRTSLYDLPFKSYKFWLSAPKMGILGMFLCLEKFGLLGFSFRMVKST